MNKEEKLKALLGEDAVVKPATDWNKFAPKPQHIYEGSDTDSDEAQTRQKPSIAALTALMPKLEAHRIDSTP